MKEYRVRVYDDMFVVNTEGSEAKIVEKGNLETALNGARPAAKKIVKRRRRTKEELAAAKVSVEATA